MVGKWWGLLDSVCVGGVISVVSRACVATTVSAMGITMKVTSPHCSQ
jgi:hypothetical protein